MNELKDERVKSLAADIKNHLPKLCGDVLVELDGYIDGAPDASGKSKISNSLCAEIDSFLTRTAPAESGKKIAERPVCPCCHGTGKDWSESCNCKEPVESARPRPRR